MSKILRHIYSLGCKEIIGIFRDYLLLILIVYSFTVSIYESAVSEPDAIDHAAIAIVDDDHSTLTKRIADAFMPPLFNYPVKVSRNDIDRLMDQGQYTFIVVFPPSFQDKIMAFQRAEIQVNVDATRMTQAFAGNGYVQQIIARETDKFLKESKKTASVPTANILIRDCYNPNLTKSWSGAVNQLANNVAMLALILTGAALIRERERGTLEHLMVTPIFSVEIMLAKVWSMSLIVWCSTAFSLLVVVHGMLHTPIAGSFALYMAGVLLNLFAMTALGIFLSCYAKDMPQFGILMILVLMPMQILSGGTTSQANMPLMVQFIMRFAPTTYFVEFSKAILFRGAEFKLIWKTFAQMFLIGCLYFGVALYRFRKTVSE